MAHSGRSSLASSDREISSRLPLMPDPVMPPLSPASDAGRDRQQASSSRPPSGLAERSLSIAHQFGPQIQGSLYGTRDRTSPGQLDPNVYFTEQEKSYRGFHITNLVFGDQTDAQ